MTNDLLSYAVADGIATILIDQKNNPTNLFSFEFITAYQNAAMQAIEDEAVKGVIVTSGQPIFMAGADIRELNGVQGNATAFFDQIMAMHRAYRTIETAGKPFVAAINGTALGGGMELCLNCHYRIALNSSKIKLGFPEVKIGLLPGGGGTAKVPYLLGIQQGLTYLLQGIEARPDKALRDGLIDAVAENTDDLLAKAKQWILDNPKPVQPWDNKRHKIPGGGLMTPVGAQTLMGAIGNVRKITHGNYPAAQFILSVVHDGLQLIIDRALEVEARYFVKALNSKASKNMIRTGFLGIQAAKKGKAKPAGFSTYEVKKLGILGAGMMGAGIAYVAAKVGMDVVLKDVSVENAKKGKAYSQKLTEKAIQKRRSTREKADLLLSKIHPTDQVADLEGCDLVVEAVFEHPNLKATVTKETEAVLEKDKIFASNTSTIPITALAKASERPENFIGIHFFSPVDKMPLVEIIVGKKTADRTIAAAVDFAIALRKIPIVVNDSRGFYTSRCFGTYCAEGAFLLEDGVPPAMIENVGKSKGMPVGPLAVTDEVSLTLSRHIFESDPTPNKPKDAQRFYEFLKKMIDEHGRTGKKDGKGYYDYPEGTKKHLWKDLNTLFNASVDAIDKVTVGKRLLHIQALEAYRCLEEGVLRSVTDGDLGSVLGWGFPIYTGGALSYLDFVGIPTFIQECDDFAAKYGERFTVPDSLRALGKAGKSIFDFGQ